MNQLRNKISRHRPLLVLLLLLLALSKVSHGLGSLLQPAFEHSPTDHHTETHCWSCSIHPHSDTMPEHQHEPLYQQQQLWLSVLQHSPEKSAGKTTEPDQPLFRLNKPPD